MFSTVFAIFLVLHGLVHLLYVGQSERFFELQTGMVWPDGAWTFASILADETLRRLVSVLLVLAAIVFVASGVGLLAHQNWWRPLVAFAAIFSSIIFILFWDGNLQNLDDKGAVGVAINVAILLAVFIFRWIDFEFSS